MTQIISCLHAVAVQRALPNHTSHIHCMNIGVYLSPEQHLNIHVLRCQSENIQDSSLGTAILDHNSLTLRTWNFRLA